MLALRDLYTRHPQETSVFLTKKTSIGGIILLVLVALGIYWMMPELRRYIRMERM